MMVIESEIATVLVMGLMGFLALAIIWNAVSQIFAVRDALGNFFAAVSWVGVIAFLGLTAVLLLWKAVAFAWN